MKIKIMLVLSLLLFQIVFSFYNIDVQANPDLTENLPTGTLIKSNNLYDLNWSNITSSEKYNNAYRFNIQGWVYVHIEGDGYERGYQYGYLAANEIVDMIRRAKDLHDENIDNWWNKNIAHAKEYFWPDYPQEYRDEIFGIADGINTKLGSIIDWEDILALNTFDESYEYMTRLKDEIHKNNKILGNLGLHEYVDHCSAFIATGDATTNGQIVMCQSVEYIYTIVERCNIILDVKPSEGYRFVTVGMPGIIWNPCGWLQNEEGIMLTCTGMGSGGPWNKEKVGIDVRCRNAIQYSKNIDEVCNYLKEGNDGTFQCQWLIGDAKTGEIASIELAYYNTPIVRKTNGVLWSCGYSQNKAIRWEKKCFFYNRIVSFAKDITFRHLVEKYYGKINTEAAKEIITTPPITKLDTTDAKITDSYHMKYNGLYAHMGRPNGVQYKPTNKEKKQHETTTILPTNGWLEVFPMIDTSGKFYSMKNNNDLNENKDVLWESQIKRGKYKLQNGKNHDGATCNIVDGIIYSSTSTGMVYAINKDTGEKIWMVDLGERTTDLTIVNDKIFVGSNEGIHVIDKNNGRILFSKQLSGFIICKPVFYNKSVIVGCSDGSVYSVNINSSSINWRCDLFGPAYLSEENNGKIIVCSDKSCYALDVKDGKTLWSYQTNGPITVCPIVDGNSVYFGSWDGTFYAVNLGNGKICWSFDIAWSIDAIPHVSDNCIYIGSNDNNIYCLDKNDGELKWFYTCKSSIHSSPVIDENFVYFGCDDGRLYALNNTNGKAVWIFKPSYEITSKNPFNYITTPIGSDLCLDEDVLYFGANGKIIALNT